MKRSGIRASDAALDCITPFAPRPGLLRSPCPEVRCRDRRRICWSTSPGPATGESLYSGLTGSESTPKALDAVPQDRSSRVWRRHGPQPRVQDTVHPLPSPTLVTADVLGSMAGSLRWRSDRRCIRNKLKHEGGQHLQALSTDPSALVPDGCRANRMC